MIRLESNIRYICHWSHGVVRALHVIVSRIHGEFLCAAIACTTKASELYILVKDAIYIPSMIDDRLTGVIPNSASFAFWS